MRPLAVAILTGVLLLGACSDDDPPAAPPSTSATTPPANPDATLPPMPDVAKEFTANGAANFVAHYVAVLDYASKTGDVTELERLSDPGCGGCSDYIELYRKTYADGGWFKGRTWSKGDSKVWFDNREGGETRLTTSITIGAGTYRLTAADNPEGAAASTNTVTLGLRYNGAWSVSQFVSGDPK